MNCIAHRGFAGVNAENTVPAVREAAARADGVEVDVRRCGSGELVVHHDETVDRTTDGSGPVADHSAAELAALHVEGGDAGVPTFDAVVAAVPPDTTLHVELKECGLAADVERTLSAADDPPEAVASAFDPGALTGVERLPTALLVTESTGAIDRAREHDCVAIHPSLGTCSRPLVEAAHNAGLAVNAWTVVNPPETERLHELGVDGAITDFPACCPDAVVPGVERASPDAGPGANRGPGGG